MLSLIQAPYYIHGEAEPVSKDQRFLMSEKITVICHVMENSVHIPMLCPFKVLDGVSNCYKKCLLCPEKF